MAPNTASAFALLLPYSRWFVTAPRGPDGPLGGVYRNSYVDRPALCVRGGVCLMMDTVDTLTERTHRRRRDGGLEAG